MNPITGQTEKDRLAYAFGEAGDYSLTADSLAQPNVSRGVLTKCRLEASIVYPGVAHEYWIYRPAVCSTRQSPALMVFLDGESFLDAAINAPAVLDNLICGGRIPPTVGLFVNPGDRGPGLPLWGGTDNRSVEYDSIDDAYARFLLDDLIPRAELLRDVSQDPEQRGIAGISSGGAAAFTVAWQRPEAFRKAMSFIGSFVAIRGANAYPALIRREERKPLRVFLQTGLKDLDVVFGNWRIANQDMAAALAYRDYDYRFILGEGGHSMKHGAAILPEAMHWLWRS